MSEPTCLRCDTALTFAGRKRFHEGTRWGILGDGAEFFMNRETFDVWGCPNCGRAELFFTPTDDRSLPSQVRSDPVARRLSKWRDNRPKPPRG